jgi:hypothetical protein
MKLSETTVSILKNFASINNGLVFKTGNQLRTIAASRALYAEANIAETIPQEFAIYDLNRLLGVLSLYKDAEVSFDEQNFIVSAGRSKTRIRFTDPKMVVAPPEGKSITIKGDVDLKKISQADLDWVDKIGTVLKCPYVVLTNNGEKVYMEVADVKGKIVDDSSLELEATHETPFKFVFKTENLKLLAGDYELALSPKGMARFTGTNVTYYAAFEQTSSWYGTPKN